MRCIFAALLDIYSFLCGSVLRRKPTVKSGSQPVAAEYFWGNLKCTGVELTGAVR